MKMPTYSKKLLPCHRAQWAFVHGTVPCTASNSIAYPLINLLRNVNEI